LDSLALAADDEATWQVAPGVWDTVQRHSLAEM